MGSDMAQYRMENILTQEIPDGLLMDIAYHWQANDNCLMDPRSAGIRHRDHCLQDGTFRWEVPASRARRIDRRLLKMTHEADTPVPESKLTRTKERWAREGRVPDRP